MAILNPYNYITVDDFKTSNIYDPVLFDNVATPDSAIQLAIIIASTQINTMCGNSINTKWDNPPSDEWKNLIQLATLPYVRNLASKGVDWLRGSGTFAEGGVASSQTNPNDPIWIPPETLGFLQQAGELVNTYLINLPQLFADKTNLQCFYAGNGYDPITWNEALNTFWRKNGVVSTDESVSITYSTTYENNFMVDLKITPTSIANAIISNPELLNLIASKVLIDPNFINTLTTSPEFEQAITNVIENDTQLQALVEQAIVQYLETDPNFTNAISQSVETLIANDPEFVNNIATALTQNESFVNTISEYVLNRINASLVSFKDSGWIDIVGTTSKDLITLDTYSNGQTILDNDYLDIVVSMQAFGGKPIYFTTPTSKKSDFPNSLFIGANSANKLLNSNENYVKLFLNLGYSTNTLAYIRGYYETQKLVGTSPNQTIEILSFSGTNKIRVQVFKRVSVSGGTSENIVFIENSIPLINNERGAIDLLDSQGNVLNIPNRMTNAETITTEFDSNGQILFPQIKMQYGGIVNFDNDQDIVNKVYIDNITNDLNDTIGTLESDITTNTSDIGNLSNLNTNVKTSLVNAVNEVNTNLNTLQDDLNTEIPKYLGWVKINTTPLTIPSTGNGLNVAKALLPTNIEFRISGFNDADGSTTIQNRSWCLIFDNLGQNWDPTNGQPLNIVLNAGNNTGTAGTPPTITTLRVDDNGTTFSFAIFQRTTNTTTTRILGNNVNIYYRELLLN